MTERLPLTNQNHLNIVTWNILLDKSSSRAERVRPQDERITSQAKTLMELGKELDVVVLQEAEGSNGQKIADMTGNEPGIWGQHSRGNEHIGLFGQQVESADFYDLGYGKKAVVTYIGNLAVFGVHFVARPKRFMRRVNESRVLCELIDEVDEAAVVGDLNGPWWEPARLMLAHRGFKSAFKEAGLKRPPTYPTEKYRDIMWTPKQQRLLPYQVSIDDIAVRGVAVNDAKTFIGDSDHVGLVAAIES